MQLLSAKEEVNTTRRRVLKSEAKRDKILKEVTTAKDEVAASRASHDSAVTKLDKLEKAIEPKEVANPPEQGEGERPLEERPPYVLCQAQLGGREAQASDAAGFPPQGASAGRPETQIK
eukprot:16346866-Heterocapsa_arctica.AAC.1